MALFEIGGILKEDIDIQDVQYNENNLSEYIHTTKIGHNDENSHKKP